MAFLEDQELVGFDIFEGFDQAQGPADFDQVGLLGLAQAEV